MEIGEYATNVLSNTEFSTIHYLYIEPSLPETPSSVVFQLEISWRQEGKLVICDPHRRGLWLFGTSDTIEHYRNALPIQVNSQGAPTKAEEPLWTILNDSNFEPSAFYKSLKAGPASLTGNSNIPNASASGSDSLTRQSQPPNTRQLNPPGAQNSTPVQDHSTNAMPLVQSDMNISLREVHELFTSAVLAMIIMRLSRLPDIVALNGRTLVRRQGTINSPKPQSPSKTGSHHLNNTITIICLDVQMTALNALIIKTSSRRAFGMGCFGSGPQISTLMNYIPSGLAVVLAPSGIMGTCVGVDLSEIPETKDSVVPETPTERSQNTRTLSTWRERCITYCQQKGISSALLDSCLWLNVQISSSSKSDDGLQRGDDVWITVQWPAPLCFFHKRTARARQRQANVLEDYDPLTFAEKWLMEKAERDALMSARLKEQEAADSASHTNPEQSSKAAHPSFSQSQVIRRSSVAGAIYPTPPDGVQNTVGATPSFEANMSTPGVSQVPNTSEPADTSIPPKDEIDDSETQPWEEGAERKESTASNMGFQDQSTDQLFGDVDTDLFGENDITDADFSFFDEPDAPNGPSSFNAKGTDSAEADLDHPTVAPDEAHADGNSAFDAIETSDDSIVPTNPSGQEEGLKGLEGGQTGINPLEPDTAPEIDIFTNQIVEPPPRQLSPPLNPEEVFKRLSSLGLKSSNIEKIETSAFGGLTFNPSLPSFTSKYGSKGRFISPTLSRTTPRSASIALPKTEYMNKRRKRQLGVTDHMTPTSPSMSSPQKTPKARRDSQSDLESDASSSEVNEFSDQDDTSNTSNDGQMLTSSSHKRKRGVDDTDHDEPIRTSFQGLQMEGDKSSDEDSVSPAGSKLFEIDYADWSLDPYFRMLRPEGYLVPFEDTEYVAIAQTLAEQAMSSTFKLHGFNDDSNQNALQAADEYRVQQILRNDALLAAESFLGSATECTLSSYLDIPDGANIGHRLPFRPMPANPRATTLPEPPRSIIPLPAPHLEVSRADSRMTVTPAAISFWENLGLGPAKGTKDVSAVCIHPRGRGLFDNVKAFLDHIGSAYETGHLGTHERFSTADFSYDLTLSNSLDPLSLQSADQLTAPTFPSFQEINTRLGSELTATSATEKNFVIYYLYDPATPEVLVHICSAFHNLFELYKASFAAAKTPITNDLVLQLVPLSFVASTSALIVPSPSEYANLAMEVYDRCVDLKTGTSPPAIVLERPPPNRIDFRLTPNPSASLLQENSIIHVAYAQSVDERWITAAWSDNQGNNQYVASYCLGRKSPTMGFSAIAAEIWDTTLGIIASRKVAWRIMIARCGAMQPSEIEFWKSLAAIDSNAQVTVTLLTVNTRPSLQLIPTSASLPPTTLAAQSSMYTTPVSTPQASIVSPEQSGNVATPARDGGPPVSTPTDTTEVVIGPDALLVDIREQSWGAILSHRLNNSNSLLEVSPTLVSGYLIKRSGAAPSDVPVLMEVNIVHSGQDPRFYEVYLRDILVFYRGLGTLGRVRGRVDGAKDVRPWHVAAAEKGVELLHMLM